MANTELQGGLGVVLQEQTRQARHALLGHRWLVWRPHAGASWELFHNVGDHFTLGITQPHESSLTCIPFRFHFLEYPFSRGKTHITSPDPYAVPDFDAGFMSDPRDMGKSESPAPSEDGCANMTAME